MPDVCIPYKLFQNLIQWYKKVFQTIKYLFCCSTHPQTLWSTEQETMKIAKKTPPFNTTPKVADGPPGYPRKFFGMLSLASRVQKSNIKTFEFELRFIEHVKVQKNALFSKKTPPLKFDKFHNYLKWKGILLREEFIYEIFPFRKRSCQNREHVFVLVCMRTFVFFSNKEAFCL